MAPCGSAGSLTTIADYDGDPGYGMTTVSAPSAVEEGEGRTSLNVVFYGGPTRGWKSTPRETPGRQLLGFDALEGELPAAMEVELAELLETGGGGQSRLLLYSPHLEAFEGVSAICATCHCQPALAPRPFSCHASSNGWPIPRLWRKDRHGRQCAVTGGPGAELQLPGPDNPSGPASQMAVPWLPFANSLPAD